MNEGPYLLDMERLGLDLPAASASRGMVSSTPRRGSGAKAWDGPLTCVLTCDHHMYQKRLSDLTKDPLAGVPNGDSRTYGIYSQPLLVVSED